MVVLIVLPCVGCGARWSDDQQAAVDARYAGTGSGGARIATGVNPDQVTDTTIGTSPGATQPGATGSGGNGAAETAGSSGGGGAGSGPVGGAGAAPCGAKSTAPGVTD